jgi:chorismate lyase / 3-hydroxybenzoate synthase
VNLRLVSQYLPNDPAAKVSRETAGVLGGALLGESNSLARAAWPEQRLIVPLQGSSGELLMETWLTDVVGIAGEREGIVWRRVGNLLYGVLELDEALFAAATTCSPLQAASAEAYRRIFRLLEAQQLPHLWRVWNYFADINGETHNLERYRQFNIGRQDAFLEFHRGATGNVPAACAIGLAGGPLSIAFMAGDLPAVPVENPRQVSAYNYPAEYGPRSPTFSRAALVYPPGQEILFISGTASIVGHRTVHPDDVAGQCREVLANVLAVLAEANRVNRSAAFVATECAYRAYVRRAEDFPVIRETLTAQLGASAEIVYVQADICRRDLLIEVEAMASHPLGNC